MANELMVRRTHLPQSQLAARAAQYVRMSTDHQRYSIENQAAVIATYAQLGGAQNEDSDRSGCRYRFQAGKDQYCGGLRPEV